MKVVQSDTRLAVSEAGPIGEDLGRVFGNITSVVDLVSFVALSPIPAVLLNGDLDWVQSNRAALRSAELAHLLPQSSADCCVSRSAHAVLTTPLWSSVRDVAGQAYVIGTGEAVSRSVRIGSSQLWLSAMRVEHSSLQPKPSLDIAHASASADNGELSGVLVLFIGAASHQGTTADSIAALLTPTELDLVDFISAGHNLREAAEKQRISYHTARKYMQNIFAKTGVRRQAELIARLHGDGTGHRSSRIAAASLNGARIRCGM